MNANIKTTCLVVSTLIVISVVVFYLSQPSWRQEQDVDNRVVSDSSSLKMDLDRAQAESSRQSKLDSEPIVASDTGSGVESLFGLPVPDRLVTLDRVGRPDDKLVDVYGPLSAKARAGDADASMVLGVSLAACAQAPRSKKQLEQWKLHVQTTESYPGTGFRARNAPGVIESYEADFEFCEGVTDDLISDFAYWIKQAAENGQVEALTEFLNSVGVDASIREEASRKIWSSAEEELAFRVRTLETAVSMGSATAMMSLSQYARKGLVPEMTEFDAKALFLAAIAARYAGGENVEMFMLRANSILNGSTEYDRARLLARSEQFLSNENCCYFFNPRQD